MTCIQMNQLSTLLRRFILLAGLLSLSAKAEAFCEVVDKMPKGAALIAQGKATTGNPFGVKLGPSSALFIKTTVDSESFAGYFLGVRSPNVPLFRGPFLTANYCGRAELSIAGQLLRVYSGDDSLLDVVTDSAGATISVEVYGTPSVKSIPTGGKAVRMTLQAKSYIARMATQKALDDGKPDAETNRNLGFDGLVGGRLAAYEFLLLTDRKFSEDPTNGQQTTGQFRLWSELNIESSCGDVSIQSVKVDPLKVAFGKEGDLDAVGEVWQQPRIVENKTAGKISSVDVDYKVRGRPNLITTPFFDTVRPRACTWIWHHVLVNLTCRDGKIEVRAQARGSAFPSRKLWVNGNIISYIQQGPFENLWICDSAQKEMVR